MTHKQYLRKVENLERAGDAEGLAVLEKERMEDLDNHLDMDFVEFGYDEETGEYTCETCLETEESEEA